MLPQPPEVPCYVEGNPGGFALHKKHKRLPGSCIIIFSLCQAIIYIFCAVGYPLRNERLFIITTSAMNDYLYKR